MARPFFWSMILVSVATSVAQAETPLFSRHVTPLLHKLGCSAGQCHGSFQGKGGFRLSLFASDPEFDHASVRGQQGRRVQPAAVEESLLLLKPTMMLGHGGGLKIPRHGPEHRLLRAWIEGGARFDAAAEGKVVGLRVEPASFTVKKQGPPQALRVFARLDSGREEDVTFFTRFESLEPSVLDVERDGKVTGQRVGDAPVLAFYAGQVAYAMGLVPGTLPPGVPFPEEILTDRVDQLLVDKLRTLNIVPSPQCSDTDFIRRVYLDVANILPTPDEVRQFLADKSVDKRARLIDRLLEHELHAALWATRFCDWLGMDSRFLPFGEGLRAHDWFRNKVENNVPWDKIAQGVLTATWRGGRTKDKIRADYEMLMQQRKPGEQTPPYWASPVEAGLKPWRTGYATRHELDAFYSGVVTMKMVQVNGEPRRIIDAKKIAIRTSYAFLGVKIDCAECHKHPNDRWTQQDFLGFAAAFTYLHTGDDPKIHEAGLPGRLAGACIHVGKQPTEVYHDPVTGAVITPHLLGGTRIDFQPGEDPRQAIARWMLSPDNPYFARAIVNRVWAHYMGRGLIEPTDALSAANPPSHPDVLDELTRDFIAHGYDLRRLQRRILNTRAYQRCWKTNATNAQDERNYSHRLLRRLGAEQVLDALAQITGLPIELGTSGYGANFRPVERAIESPDSRPSIKSDGFVLQLFGKPMRTQTCECERVTTPNLNQVLYLYNDRALQAKIAAPKGRLHQLVQRLADDPKLVEELYLLVLSRLPTAAEQERAAAYVRAAPSRVEAFEDLLWSLLNQREFLVNH